MSPRSRRQITGQQKVEIVKRHLVDGVPVSTLCEEYKIQPTQFYTWQKQLFENGEKAFEKAFCGFGEEADRQARSQLVQKNEFVAELLEEHVKLKKELGEL